MLDRVRAVAIAASQPASPSACADSRKPIRCASSATADSSASVSCSGSGSSSSFERAPVVMTLMKSAPARICSRTARRMSSGPSASRYMSP